MSPLRPGGNAVSHPSNGCRLYDDATETLVVGLVNNMPDAAFAATEQQLRELLSAASCGRPVRLRLFSAPEIPRGQACRTYISLAYESIDQLWGGELDGLIVSGAEPRARFLEDEPYWPTLAKLTDWAEQRTASTIWSCLAAQAAVLRADGIVRRPFGFKLSGVYDCTKAAEHPLTAGLPSCWRSPQTRYNDLPEPALVSSGYRVLSHLPDAGADMFIREGRSLFLFLQGHPEYGPDSLLREYRRDIGRFLMGERDTYPDPMHGYFDKSTRAALNLFRNEALRTREPELIDRLPAALNGWTPSHSWREPTIQLYGNWMRYLAQCKAREVGHSRFAADRSMTGDVSVSLGVSAGMEQGT